MDIQKESNAYLATLVQQEAITQDEFKDIAYKPEINAFHSKYLSSHFVDNINWGWNAWQAAKASAVPEILENDCMIGQAWFMKGSSVAALIKHAEGVYKAEVAAQNSKIEFGTDDNEHWFAHDVPFFGTVQIDRIEEHGLVEWDIHFNDCWQGPFNSKSECIKHLEECILEQRAEAQEPSHD